MIPLPDNQAVVRVKVRQDVAEKFKWKADEVEGSVFRTQTGRKLNPVQNTEGPKSYINERLVSIRDSEGIEHTVDLDTEVETLTVVKERKDVQADLAAAESASEVAPDEATPEGEVVPPEGG